MTSDYKSPEADRYSPTIQFKFSINSRDNEMVSGKDHSVTLQPENGCCTTTVQFGRQYVHVIPVANGFNLEPNTRWNVRLDMREVISSFKEKGFYTLFNGENWIRLTLKVYILPEVLPL